MQRIGWDDTPNSYAPGPDVPPGIDDGAPLALRGAPFRKTLRFFQFGPHAADDSFQVYRQDPCQYNIPYPAEGIHLLPLLAELTRVE